MTLFGIEELKREYKEKGLLVHSFAGFVKGELVCYVTAHETDEKNRDLRTFYISDVNCPNPIYLERLLLHFFADVCGMYSDIKEIRFKADMRFTSYRLICSRDKRSRRGIHLGETGGFTFS